MDRFDEIHPKTRDHLESFGMPKIHVLWRETALFARLHVVKRESYYGRSKEKGAVLQVGLCAFQSCILKGWLGEIG